MTLDRNKLCDELHQFYLNDSNFFDVFNEYRRHARIKPNYAYDAIEKLVDELLLYDEDGCMGNCCFCALNYLYDRYK